MSELADIRRKLVEGTEVLRTGGGATLKAGECAALLSRLDTLEADCTDEKPCEVCELAIELADERMRCQVAEAQVEALREALRQAEHELCLVSSPKALRTIREALSRVSRSEPAPPDPVRKRDAEIVDAMLKVTRPAPPVPEEQQ